ncbi:MAG: hypothetical protein KDA80_23115, partial [Planctomycetaceae bacterium]|nr:hypothetical protein [Planctomycetaceae bacterium]
MNLLPHVLPLRELVACSLLVAVLAGPALAQDPGRQSVAEDPPPPTSLEKLDSVFKSAVNVMELLLFYRLGQTERDYIQFQPGTPYVRDRGSEGNFEKLNDGDPYPASKLTPDEVQILGAQKKTTGGHTLDGAVRSYRHGILGNELVDYVIVK